MSCGLVNSNSGCRRLNKGGVRPGWTGFQTLIRNLGRSWRNIDCRCPACRNSAYQQGMLGAKGIDVSGDVDIGGIGCLAVGIEAIATVIDGDGGGSRIDAAIPIYLR